MNFLRKTLAAGIFAGLFASLTLAQDELASHVKDADFAPIEIPEWVYQGVGITFGGDEIASQLAAAGVSVVHNAAAQAYYPLVADDPVHGGIQGEKKAALIKRCAQLKAAGITFVGAIHPSAPAELVRLHPDWLTRGEDNNKVEVTARETLAKMDADPKVEGFFSLCLISSPWRDYYVRCLTEMVRDYGFYGVSFDGNYHPPVCYCTFCKAQYKKDTGREIPAKVDIEDVDYRIYLVWLGDRLESYYRQLGDGLRSANPEAVVYSWSVNAGRWGQLLSTPRYMSRRMNLLMVPMQEWWLDETNMGDSVVPPFGAAYMYAVSGHRVGVTEAYLMSRGNPYGTDSFPATEVMARAMQATTNGAYAAFSIGWGGHFETALSVFRAVKACAPWTVHAKPLPYAAMLVGEQTRQFYGLRDPAGRYLPHPLGMFRAALESHTALNILTEWDLTPAELAKYKVLVLPNAACLSDAQIATIREYVAAGGGLVATSETSLFDEIGRPRQDFGLADVFGVNFKGRPSSKGEKVELDSQFVKHLDASYWAQREGAGQLRWDVAALNPLTSDTRLNTLVPYGQVTMKGPQLLVSEPVAPMQVAARLLPSVDNLQAETIPGVIYGTFGKGRVVYMPAGVDAAYYSYWYPYQRRFLAGAVEWAAAGPQPIQVEAPMCVQSTFFTQENEGKSRTVIHLFNDLKSTGGHGKPDVDIPMREEYIPISDIQLKLAPGHGYSTAVLQPEGTSLPIAHGPEGDVVTVPKLTLHTLVVLQ